MAGSVAVGSSASLRTRFCTTLLVRAEYVRAWRGADTRRLRETSRIVRCRTSTLGGSPNRIEGRGHGVERARMNNPISIVRKIDEEEAQAEDWLAGGGEMGELVRETDWSKTKIGPVEY